MKELTKVRNRKNYCVTALIDEKKRKNKNRRRIVEEWLSLAQK